MFEIDSLGLPVNGTVVSSIFPFDARERDWYMAAKNAPRRSTISWTSTKLLGDCGCLGVTASRAIYFPDSSLAMIAGTNLRL